MAKQKHLQNIILGLKRILHAFKFSYDGFIATLKSEPAFRQDLVVCVFFTPIAFMLDVTATQRVLLISSLLFILFAECVNTAIETIIDRISTSLHSLSKKAKDIGSLLVLMAFINAMLTWTIILWD